MLYSRQAFQLDRSTALHRPSTLHNFTSRTSVLRIASCRQEPSQKQPVIVAGKDVKEVDNDYFLIPVKIMDHEGPFSADFPIENRLLPQGTSDACTQLYALEYISNTLVHLHKGL